MKHSDRELDIINVSCFLLKLPPQKLHQTKLLTLISRQANRARSTSAHRKLVFVVKVSSQREQAEDSSSELKMFLQNVNRKLLSNDGNMNGIPISSSSCDDVLTFTFSFTLISLSCELFKHISSSNHSRGFIFFFLSKTSTHSYCSERMRLSNNRIVIVRFATN